MVCHSIRGDLQKQGVIFLDTDSALRELPNLVREYFGTVIPPEDNKFAALNSAVWSSGSFVYIPKGVDCDVPLQAYFRINSENMGQFERTLIIAEEGSFGHYVEGCTAPSYNSQSLHSAVVEVVVKNQARIRYTWGPARHRAAYLTITPLFRAWITWCRSTYMYQGVLRLRRH